MQETALRNLQAYHDGYCSQPSSSPPSIQKIEQGCEIIEQILKKNVICRHDVAEINRVYTAIDLLERKIDKIPELNSNYVLTLITKKIKNIVSYTLITARDLISVYHLQGFLDEGLCIKKHFEKISSQFGRNLPLNKDRKEEIAAHLPCCYSVEDFDRDVDSLIGPDRSEKIEQILQRKKQKLQKYEYRKEGVATRKARQTNGEVALQQHPAYLNELLDKGYIHLYDHLIEMQKLSSREERRAEIEKMEFSSLSHIVLETREAIIRRVESSIPPHCNKILFLLGGSGSGKSTTLCFFRGDKMVREGDTYKSQSDTNELIGHEGATSCTFLPTTEIVNGIAIVDFPGFDDTNGQLVSLGAELALKALTVKYNPKILVLESITNNEGRYAAAGRLGARLTRLLGDKNNCILGITKYVKDPDSIRIQGIENAQRQQLSTPTDEEKKLEATIEVLRQYAVEKVEEAEEQLASLKQKRKQQALTGLPETDAQKTYKKNLQEKEEELLKQMGLKTYIRFSHLEDPNHLAFCFEIFANAFNDDSHTPTIRATSQLCLDRDDLGLLENRFKNDLVKKINKKEYKPIKNVNRFIGGVLESSFIKIICYNSNPEIGALLHLPEMDSSIVQEYDKEIIESCVNGYIKAIISTLSISSIKNTLTQIGEKASSKKIKDIEGILNQLQSYVKGLLGDFPEDSGQSDREWERRHTEYQETVNQDIEKRFTFSTLTKIFAWAPLGIPMGIIKLVEIVTHRSKIQGANDQLLDECITELNRVYEGLQQFVLLRNMIKRRSAIEEAFHSVPIVVDSIDTLKETIKEKIDKVRTAYGANDWDRRVEPLINQTDEEPALPHSISPLLGAVALAHAYRRINPLVDFNKIVSTIKLQNKPPFIVNMNSPQGFSSKVKYQKDIPRDTTLNRRMRYAKDRLVLSEESIDIESLTSVDSVDSSQFLIMENNTIVIEAIDGIPRIIQEVDHSLKHLPVMRTLLAAALLKKYEGSIDALLKLTSQDSPRQEMSILTS